MLMLVKDFAAKQGVSTAVIYKHLKNHQSELEGKGLVIKKPKQTLLTEEAQEYLENIMIDKMVVTNDASKSLKIAELEEENKRLLIQLAEARAKLVAAMEEMGNQKAIAARVQSVESLNESLADQRDNAKARVQELEKELESLKNRPLWQRIFNKTSKKD